LLNCGDLLFINTYIYNGIYISRITPFDLLLKWSFLRRHAHVLRLSAYPKCSYPLNKKCSLQQKRSYCEKVSRFCLNQNKLLGHNFNELKCYHINCLSYKCK